MAYEPISPFWQGVGYWQTLIAGVLAVLAAISAVWATIASANREVASAQAQTEAAANLERRRVARETFSFFAMLEAAMATLLEDIAAARVLVVTDGDDDQGSGRAFDARQRLKKSAFQDLRNAFLRFGGQLTAQFLRLDREIDEFSSKSWRIATTSAGDPLYASPMKGLRRELESIELRAKALCEEAAGEMKRCTKLLTESESTNMT
jgi:type II secretory pathway pseudopilin PulG